jgi:hypothetical protein
LAKKKNWPEERRNSKPFPFPRFVVFNNPHLIVAHVQHFNVRASGQSIPMQIHYVLKVMGKWRRLK